MAEILALEKLYTDVLSLFLEEGTFSVDPDPDKAAKQTADANPFGWREPSRQGNRDSRIVWVPGDPSGALGPVEGPKYPGRIDPGRPLATLNELFTVYISAADRTKPISNEFRQWKAARLLFDAWYRAVYLAAHGTFRILSSSWQLGKIERQYGAAIRVVAAIESMVPDEAPELAPADTGALIDVEELDLTEQVSIAAPSLETHLTDSDGNDLTDDDGDTLTD